MLMYIFKFKYLFILKIKTQLLVSQLFLSIMHNFEIILNVKISYFNNIFILITI